MEPIGAAEIIARIIGPVYVVVSIGMFVNPETYRRTVEDFMEQPALCYLSGLFALSAGVAILTFHFVWRADWTALLSIVGCVAVLKGAALTVAPNWSLGIWKPLLRRPGLMRAGGLVALALGLFLGGKGYGII